MTHLHNLSTAVILRRGPVDDTVVVEDLVDVAAARSPGFVHDVHIDVLLGLALGVTNNHLVRPGLGSLRVEDVHTDLPVLHADVDVMTVL